MRLSEFRKARQITQKDLADAVGVTQAYISNLESGKRKNPSLNVLVRISRVLDVDIRNLIEGNLL